MLNERLIYLSPLGFNLLESQHVADEYINILIYQYMYCVIISFFIVSADRPLIVQFAANNGNDLANAAEIVAP